jgi:hypothetical protein
MHDRHRAVRHVLPVAVVTMVCLALSSCSLGSGFEGSVTTTCTTVPGPAQAIGCHSPTTPNQNGPTVHVTVENFHILLPATIPTGRVTFVVYGRGPTLHEFNIARSSLRPRQLPIALDDKVNDLHDTADFVFLGQVEDIDIGVTASLTVNITPGHYVFYCNMDGHYMAGMSAQAAAL